MSLEFLSGETIPEVERGHMRWFIVVIERPEGRRTVLPAWYLNAHELYYEDCQCANEADHGDDGCPTTGWFHDSSNFDYENCYQRVTGKIIAYAQPPDAETAMTLIRGPW